VSRAKRALLWLQAVAYALAGFNHLMNPAFYLRIIPPDLPGPGWLNLVSGLAEIVLGVFLLAEPRVRALAAWGLVALLVAVFPANVYAALANVGDAGALAWVRLPFQALFIVWAWWYTDPEEA
jgi:uncharacterized membrane protein